MGLRDLVRTLLAVAGATFLAGAAVSLRLHLRHGPADWPQVASQGFEVMAWFTLFAAAAVLAATRMARGWPAFAGRRLVVGGMAYALAVAAFLLAMSTTYPEVAQDLLAHLYLAVGSLAGALAVPPSRSPPAQVAAPAAA